MSIEMWSIFALSAMLFGLIGVQGSLAPIIHGFKWGLGSRDRPVEITPLQGRFARTVANQLEAIAIFVPLMGLVLFLDLQSPMTQLAAWLTIGGRLAFIAFYLVGVFAVRSLAFTAGVVANFILIAQLV